MTGTEILSTQLLCRCIKGHPSLLSVLHKLKPDSLCGTKSAATMASTLTLVLCLGMMAVSLATPINTVRWCVKSEVEQKKCRELSKTCGSENIGLSCVLRSSNADCFDAIFKGAADAVTLDSGEVHKASLTPYSLRPVAAENYGTKEAPDTCYYSVALVSKTSTFMFKDLKGKKSCHTAVKRAAGWVSPIGTLLSKGLLTWEGPEIQSSEKVVSEFFSGSCAPGATEPNLCKLCAGKDENKCKASESEPFYGYSGACACLKQGKGDVAFVKHIMKEECKKNTELLCLDNTRKPVEDYKNCYWGQLPSHAVVTADKEDKIKTVTQFLEDAQKKTECKLFGSAHGKDLMFKDSATSLIPLTEKMDAFLFLGRKYTDASKALDQGVQPPSQDKIQWCTQSAEEKSKCDNWSIMSGGAVECIAASDAEECMVKVLKGEADAVALDGGYLNTAGKCGLVPAMQEIYDVDVCKSGSREKKGTYYAVAVVKKSDKNITWKTLKGVKSCHTGLGRTAGYNIPVGLIYKDTKNCDLGSFFKQSCIPGADPESNLCSLCAGNPDKPTGVSRCLPNNQEHYYGYDGAIRCLKEVGDVAFVKHTTVPELCKDKTSQSWTKGLKEEDFELLCPDGTRKPISEYKSCHLALVPSHAVATTPERKPVVAKILKAQERNFGRNGDMKDMFQMFVSEGKKDQIFKDSTQCLSEVTEDNMDDFLGKEYTDALTALYKCGKTGLLAACTFHTCKPE